MRSCPSSSALWRNAFPWGSHSFLTEGQDNQTVGSFMGSPDNLEALEHKGSGAAAENSGLPPSNNVLKL